MPAIRTVSYLGALVMVVALINGFVSGDFGVEGEQILDLVWGRITLIDLYVGIALFTTFVAWREGSVIKTLPWLIGFMVLGNLATAAYIAWAARSANSASELFSQRQMA